MNGRATIQDETTKINQYIKKMAPSNGILGKYFRQQKNLERRSVRKRNRHHGKTPARHVSPGDKGGG